MLSRDKGSSIFSPRPTGITSKRTCVNSPILSWILSKAPLLKNYGRPSKMASSILWTGTSHPKSVRKRNPYLGSTATWRKWCGANPDYSGTQRSQTSGVHSSHSRNTAKRSSRERRSTTSMMSFKKDLMRTTPNHSGDMSIPDVKITLVYPPWKRWDSLSMPAKKKHKLWLSSFSLSSQEKATTTYLIPGREPNNRFRHSPLQ